LLWTPRKGVVRYESNLGNVGTLTPGTSCTTGAGSSTKGTAVQLIAATAFDAFHVRILASNYGLSATTARGCLDILIGAATEEVLIPNLLMGFCGGSGVTTGGPLTWDFPLFIPAGSRLAAQVAGDRLSTAMRVGIQLWGGVSEAPWRTGGRVTTYGIGTVPAGTTVTSGASGAEGAFIQIVASTTDDHFAFVPSFQPPSGDTTLTPGKHFYMDIGIGAATEEILGGSPNQCPWIYTYSTDELCGGPWGGSMPIFADVPSGTRLAARLSASGALDAASPNCAIHAVS